MNIVEELKCNANNSKCIKKIIRDDDRLVDRLYADTWFLEGTQYDNFNDRYKFLRIGGNENNFRCPYCGKVRKMSQSLLCDTCGDDLCLKKHQHKVKKEMNKNMSEETKRRKAQKMKETCLKRYGCEYSTQSEQMKQKSRSTKLERYNDEKYANIEKRLKTNRKRYGGNAPLCNDSIKRKVFDTNIKRYGVGNVFQSEYIKSKIVETNIHRYGVPYPMMSKDIRNKVNYEKAVERQFLSKQKNGTLHTSSHEDIIFEYLLEKYGNVKKQYTDERYINPQNKVKFKCDFYLSDYDLFIEYQGIYHHGGEPFNENNKFHIEKLKRWKDLSKKHSNSDYNEAIKIWTIKDPLKRKVAMEKNLNYLEIWSENGNCPTKENIIQIIENKINSIKLI